LVLRGKSPTVILKERFNLSVSMAAIIHLADPGNLGPASMECSAHHLDTRKEPRSDLEDSHRPIMPQNNHREKFHLRAQWMIPPS